MEAARILSTLGVRPKRTIRFALWAGEEQGLLGSLSYVEKYLATRAPAPGTPETAIEQFARWRYRFPITPLPGHKDLVAYFNIDNGSGKVRGIYAEGNVAAVPLLREWLQPFASMGASAVVAMPTGGTDHVFMQAVGVPGYQFIQDPLDYRFTRPSQQRRHLRSPEGARTCARPRSSSRACCSRRRTAPKTLPRMPVPTRGVDTDPFKYDDPDEN